MRFGLVVLQPVIDLNHFSKIGIGEQAQIIEVPTVQVSDARRQKMPGLPFYTDVPGKLLKCPHESSSVPPDQALQQPFAASVTPVLGVGIAVPLVAKPLYQIRQGRPALRNHVIDDGLRGVGELVAGLFELDAQARFAISDPNTGSVLRIEAAGLKEQVSPDCLVATENEIVR